MKRRGTNERKNEEEVENGKILKRYGRGGGAREKNKKDEDMRKKIVQGKGQRMFPLSSFLTVRFL